MALLCGIGLSAVAGEATPDEESSEPTVAVALTAEKDAPVVPVDSIDAAKKLDALLAREWQAVSDESADVKATDEVFVRRASFDLIGELPTPEEITLFLLDQSADKRARLVERLVADPRYGLNWSRYWRDVILSRRSDERALLASESVTRYLADAFNQGTPWDQIATDFVTADGSLAEDGRTALLASQWGEIPETAAEVARILMGVQIQCAQCHDHPTDRWQREQFHELAAFFPRIGVRAVRVEGKRRGFEVYAREDAPRAAKVKPVKLGKAAKRFEHFMPDLDDPSAEGTLMQPVFFVTGQQLPTGAKDSQRRETLAAWITAPENPWFARAIVNRYWAELVGVGMYEPIDDLGPDRECTAPESLDFLASQFVAHDYDIKWLVRTIAATNIYSRESKPRPVGGEAPSCGCPQPLRADQLFNALTQALGLEGLARSDAGAGDPRRGDRSPRGQFQQVFGFDPSEPRDEIAGSVSQALMLMNSPALAKGMSLADSQGATNPLVRLLAEARTDDEIFVELYLRCLGREPHADELKICRQHVAKVGDRREAVEDLLWALVNSTEFLYRD
ncbi:MAG: DUF1549 domain-containing protein [Pirellulales bacterium]